MKESELAEWKTRALAAEKTANVLKDKVWSFYNGDAQTPIQRQLARSERRKELSQVRAAELARHANELEAQVKERMRDLRRIHDHVASGFLVVGEDLLVRADFTKSCHRLLAASEIAGRYLPELLRVERKGDAEHLAHALGQVFADELPEEICLDAVPRRFPIGDQVISLEASVIRNENKVEALLLTINDITSLEEAQRKIVANEVLIGILTQRSAFRSFVADTRALLMAAREGASASAAFARRCLHTVKGNAAAFQLGELVALIHGYEGKSEFTVEDVRAVESAFQSFLAENESVLEVRYDLRYDEVYELRGADLDELRASAGDPAKVEAWINYFALKRTDHALGPLEQYVEKLAERLEKRVDFVVKGGGVMIDPRYLGPVLQNLTHVLRNAVDHGIEPAEERGAKPERGRVQLAMGEDARTWELEISDDGRGIDAERLTAIAIERGVVTADDAAALALADRLALVFVDGLSTRSFSTEVSGRGVGMAALKASVERLGGAIRVESTLGTGTRVVLSLPKPAMMPAE